jgi:hypothetical protein
VPERITEVREEGRLGKSDHTMIVFEVSIDSKPAEVPKTRPDWARADWDKARRTLAGVSWQAELRGLSTQEAWDRFKNRIEAVMEDCVPRRRCRNKNRPPWMT